MKHKYLIGHCLCVLIASTSPLGGSGMASAAEAKKPKGRSQSDRTFPPRNVRYP